MKKEVTPGLAVLCVAVVVIVLGGVIWKMTSAEQTPITPKGTVIKLPPSQVGTKLGGRVLGSEESAPVIPSK